MSGRSADSLQLTVCDGEMLKVHTPTSKMKFTERRMTFMALALLLLMINIGFSGGRSR